MQGFSAVRARACAGPGLTDKPQARATEGRRQAGQAQVLAHGAADLRQGTALSVASLGPTVSCASRGLF